MSDHYFSQLSDIVPENEASASSVFDEDSVLQIIKEASSEEHTINSAKKDAKNLKFLEDHEILRTSRRQSELAESLLDKSSFQNSIN